MGVGEDLRFDVASVLAERGRAVVVDVIETTARKGDLLVALGTSAAYGLSVSLLWTPTVLWTSFSFGNGLSASAKPKNAQ